MSIILLACCIVGFLVSIPVRAAVRMFAPNI